MCRCPVFRVKLSRGVSGALCWQIDRLFVCPLVEKVEIKLSVYSLITCHSIVVTETVWAWNVEYRVGGKMKWSCETLHTRIHATHAHTTITHSIHYKHTHYKHKHTTNITRYKHSQTYTTPSLSLYIYIYIYI